MYEADGQGNGNLINEILCFVSIIIIFIALFAAIVTQTISSFSLPQVPESPEVLNEIFQSVCLVFMEDSCFK